MKSQISSSILASTYVNRRWREPTIFWQQKQNLMLDPLLSQMSL
jgi:hypothetical protein